MKVFDLECAQHHVFEGWFASEADYQSQLERAFLVCPVCSNAQITKRLSAPRLNLGAAAPQAAQPQPPAEAPSAAGELAAPQAQQRLWMAAVRHLVANTEDVGKRFADEARRMHQGDAPERGIRGQATSEEREALKDEGIDVMHLPMPDFAKETLQ